MTTSGEKSSIFDAIGGCHAIKVAVDRFYDQVLADPELSGYFTGVELRRLKAHQRSFLAAALGGEEIYRGRSMAEAHAHLRVRPEHFDRVVDHLVATLRDLGVAELVIAEIGAKLLPLCNEIAPHHSPAARCWRWFRTGSRAS